MRRGKNGIIMRKKSYNAKWKSVCAFHALKGIVTPFRKALYNSSSFRKA